MSEIISSLTGYVDDAGGGIVTIVVDRSTPNYPVAGDEVHVTVRHKVKDEPRVCEHKWRLHRVTPVSQIAVKTEWSCELCPQRHHTDDVLCPPE